MFPTDKGRSTGVSWPSHSSYFLSGFLMIKVHLKHLVAMINIAICKSQNWMRYSQVQEIALTTNSTFQNLYLSSLSTPCHLATTIERFSPTVQLHACYRMKGSNTSLNLNVFGRIARTAYV